MRHGLVCLGVILLTGFSISTAPQQEKGKEATATPAPAAPTAVAATAEAAKPAGGAERKNPVKATPEGIAAVKKIYGYDCAMCHGLAGDGKGDVAASMSLTLKDWREPGVLAGISDGDMYDLIVKGKGKMLGEGDRLPPEKAWNMVHYVRSFAKGHGSAEKDAAAAAPKS
ncbi:MAG TPA: cytochrome c [Candidatus Acidoferrum sp.]|nr:cytochrome c [Candidatus Acidoferrum sp.]